MAKGCQSVFKEQYLETYLSIFCTSLKSYMVNVSLSCTSNLSGDYFRNCIASFK